MTHTHYTLYREKNEYGQLSNCQFTRYFFSKYGKEKLGGLSNDGEDLSWGQQL